MVYTYNLVLCVIELLLLLIDCQLSDCAQVFDRFINLFQMLDPGSLLFNRGLTGPSLSKIMSLSFHAMGILELMNLFLQIDTLFL